MTLAIHMSHGSKGYPATGHATGSNGSCTIADEGPTAPIWIHSGKSAVVHELQPGETAEQAQNRALQRMWNAYAAQGGGKTFDGKPLPTWDELGDERQSCWRAALNAI